MTGWEVVFHLQAPFSFPSFPIMPGCLSLEDQRLQSALSSPVPNFTEEETEVREKRFVQGHRGSEGFWSPVLPFPSLMVFF